MKYHAYISSVLLFLSCLLGVFIAFETGLLGYTDLSASDSGAEARAQEDVEIQIKRRERALNEKEIILKEQMTRYEKLIVELRTKLESKEKEHSATLSDKDRDTQAKVAALEKQVKELKESKEREVKNLKDTKDQEIKKLQAQIKSQDDEKKKNYRTIYEKMESKKAAKIIEEMDLNLAATIVESLKQDRAAEILSKMSAERARRITEKSLGKRQTASAKVSDPVDPNLTAIENIPKGGE